MTSEIEDKITEQENEKEEDEIQDYQPKSLSLIQSEKELIQIMFDTLREKLK